LRLVKQVYFAANNSKLLERIQNFVFTPIKDGISKTVECFEEKYKNSRK
jgi:hypothetical protein